MISTQNGSKNVLSIIQGHIDECSGRLSILKERRRFDRLCVAEAEMLMKRSQQKYSFDYFFEFVLLIYHIYCFWVVFFAFLDTTTVSFIWKSEVLNPVRLILFGITLISIMLDIFQKKNWTRLELCGVALIFLAFWGSYFSFKRRFLLDVAVLIAGAKGKDFKKILKLYLAACMAALVISVTLAQLGITENLVFIQDRALRPVRYAFGSLYVTDFCAHLLYMSAAGMMLTERKRKWIVPVFLLIEAFFSFWFCGAFTATICFLLLIMVWIFADQHKLEERKYVRNTFRIGAAMPSILAAVMLSLSYTYNPEIRWMKTLNRVIHGRLKYGKLGFERYAVRLFGQYVELNGNGGKVGKQENYFFLDCSYVNILFCLGAIALIAVLMIMTVNCYKAWKCIHWLLLGILVVICIDSIMEHHLANIAYNPFLVMVFADISWLKEKTV